jgi:hypothetical protein
MVGKDLLWRKAVENPKSTTIVLLFALTLALIAFGITMDLAGGGTPAGPIGGSRGP